MLGLSLVRVSIPASGVDVGVRHSTSGTDQCSGRPDISTSPLRGGFTRGSLLQGVILFWGVLDLPVDASFDFRGVRYAKIMPLNFAEKLGILKN